MSKWLKIAVESADAAYKQEALAIDHFNPPFNVKHTKLGELDPDVDAAVQQCLRIALGTQ